jgi:heme/copper-type cytochrome/quinol oxidase subunit 4
MKTLLLVILVFVGILIRLLSFLPWGRNDSQRGNLYGKRFLLGIAIVSLVLILGWFWFAMRLH